jgi:hypothetical protein
MLNSNSGKRLNYRRRELSMDSRLRGNDALTMEVRCGPAYNGVIWAALTTPR